MVVPLQREEQENWLQENHRKNTRVTLYSWFVYLHYMHVASNCYLVVSHTDIWTHGVVNDVPLTVSLK